ncbi:insulinase family protein [Massilia sp. Dwa41.01b]|uniref:M16 family metallopeptidase n=1 Tax=unclassified Massilia TaxID=2609279 RepID=UPI0016036A63|nr:MULTISPECIES: pitrilysin family protein [unclassified Massilia]QNA87816.1 insulinase family protein [Massilia sp. Dwa41.01b]QNA98718.1 insulinase family protein [Massilia sp. Se16.2.3]
MKVLVALMVSAGILSPVFAAGATAAVPVQARSAVSNKPLKVTSVEGITEYRLANGMRVLLFPDASKPTLTTNMVYMVGSRHENYGETGMAHLLEHLLFKPTANFGVKKGTSSPVEVLKALGADFNGTTWYDRTNYYATFPANDDNLRTMLALEADRMVNAPISQDDLWNTKTNKGEMTVVRNEFEIGESNPIGVTTDRLQAVAYDWHNYGKSTIGARSDIEQVNIPRLRAFYKQYYQPDNAVLIVAGRFDEAKTLAQINALFGKIAKPSRVIQPTYTAEPVQDGERSVTVRRAGGTQFVGAGYHVAPSGHPDAAALQLLAHVLTNAPSGRLHKALVETRLATSLDYSGVSNLEPGYRIFGAVVPTGQPLAPTQEALLKVLEDLKSNPVTEEEVARARQAVAKNIELALNDSASLTIALTESMAAGDWRLFFLNRDQVEKTDVKAVQAAAEKYLKASNRTLGVFIPTDAPDRAAVPGVTDVAAMVKDYKGRAVVAQGEAFDPSPANIEARTQRFQLANGLKGALLPKKTKGSVVTATIKLRFGSEEALRNTATAGSFAAGLLSYGTQEKSRQQLKDAFDKLKARIQVFGSAENLNATVTTTRENLPAVMDLLAEMLQKPAFAPAGFGEFQRANVNATEQAIPEPNPQASTALGRLLDPTPEGHVKHVRTLQETLAAQKGVTVEEVKAFHAAFYGADNATFAAVGDFDAAALQAQVERLYGNWHAQQKYVRVPSAMKAVAGQKLTLATPDKASSLLLAVVPVPLKDDAKAYPALLMADYMLGGGALRSRLADRIRQKEGLSYGVGSQLNVPRRDPAGMWMAYAMSAPQNTAKVEAVLREELQRAVSEGFTEAELQEAKKGWLQGEEVSRTSDEALAGALSEYLSLDRTMQFDAAVEDQVRKLTLAQVNEAMRQFIKPDAISIVAAGDFAKAEPQAVGGAK